MSIPIQVSVAEYSDERTDEVTISCDLGPTAYNSEKGYITSFGPNYTVTIKRVVRQYFPDREPIIVRTYTIVKDLPALMSDPVAISMISSLPPLFDQWAQDSGLSG